MEVGLGEIGAGEVGVRQVSALAVDPRQIAIRAVIGAAGEEVVALIGVRRHYKRAEQDRRSDNEPNACAAHQPLPTSE